MASKHFNPFMLSAVLGAGLLSACGGGGSADVSAAGVLRVALTDAPACGFDAVNVTVGKVRVHAAAEAAEDDRAWREISLNPARKINLLDLTNGVIQELGQTSLPAGRYNQIRLILDTGSALSNSVVVTGSSGEIALDTPSALKSGIKIINPVDVAGGQVTDLVLDFDACKSVVTRGNGRYLLKPVVKAVPAAANGIEGYLDKAQLGANVAITAQQNGVIVGGTVPDAQTGRFLLSRLPAGEYDVVMTADGRATAVISKVPVTAGAVVGVSSGAAPIALAAAETPAAALTGNVSASPVNAGEDVAIVSARQSFAGGPTVTVKYRAADALNGSYALTLPTAAPRLAIYAPALPLTFAAQPSVLPGVGKYAVEAALPGYQTQSASIDLNAGSVTRNFALTR